MRVMVIVKASKDSEAGKMPDPQLITDMGKFNEELVKAGVNIGKLSQQIYESYPRRRIDLGVGHNLGHHAEIERFLGRQHRRHQIELACLGAAEHLRQEIGAAIVAGKADFRKGSGDFAGLSCHAEIAGQRDG